MGGAAGPAALAAAALADQPAEVDAAVQPVTGLLPASTPALVAVCETCHRPDGDAIPVIHGRPAAILADALRAFPGQTDVTVMHRIAVGLSAAEVEAVALALAEARDR